MAGAAGGAGGGGGGRQLELTLAKADAMAWWRCVVRGQPEIDVQGVEPEASKLTDLGEGRRWPVGGGQWWWGGGLVEEREGDADGSAALFGSCLSISGQCLLTPGWPAFSLPPCLQTPRCGQRWRR